MLIVDDSAVVRQMLTEILSSDPAIDVVGTAADPLLAREKIKRLAPDVITLDVEMPRMDGLAFLENLMRLHPLPVVMISSLTERGADTTLQALALGAVDFVSKPKLDVARGLQGLRRRDHRQVKMAARSRVRPLVRAAAPKLMLDAAPAIRPAAAVPHHRPTDRDRFLGGRHRSAARGAGRHACRRARRGDDPAFAGQLQQCLRRTPGPALGDGRARASDGEAVLPGHAYLPPAASTWIIRDGARWRCRVDDGPAVNRHKPAVDVLFRSVAQNAGGNAIGAILTGMGDDGARGLLEMRQAGAPTLVQDEATSVVWGMPGAAFKLGAAEEQVPLERIAERLLALARG